MNLLKSVALLCVFVLCGVLTGCKPEQLEDGYQVGDGLQMVLQATVELQAMRNDWCENQNVLARDTLLAMVRMYKPDYPEGGLCADDSLVIYLAKLSVSAQSEQSD